MLFHCQPSSISRHGTIAAYRAVERCVILHPPARYSATLQHPKHKQPIVVAPPHLSFLIANAQHRRSSKNIFVSFHIIPSTARERTASSTVITALSNDDWAFERGDIESFFHGETVACLSPSSTALLTEPPSVAPFRIPCTARSLCA